MPPERRALLEAGGERKGLHAWRAVCAFETPERWVGGRFCLGFLFREGDGGGLLFEGSQTAKGKPLEPDPKHVHSKVTPSG